MNFVGDEKRIQALFHELKLEDLYVVPEFDQLWNEAQVSRSETFALPLRSSATPLIVAAFALVVMSAMFLLSGSRDRALEIPELVIVEMSKPILVNNPESFLKRKIARRNRAQVARPEMIRDVVALSTWKSPTRSLMETPARFEINTLPQLNQASQELQAFLPGNDGKN